MQEVPVGSLTLVTVTSEYQHNGFSLFRCSNYNRNASSVFVVAVGLWLVGIACVSGGVSIELRNMRPEWFHGCRGALWSHQHHSLCMCNNDYSNGQVQKGEEPGDPRGSFQA